MSKLSLGSRRRPESPVPPQRQQWRAYDDGPINLGGRRAADPAIGQKAFVLAFAAVAVAGAAYFATVMIAPDDDPTAVISRANARPQVEAQVAAAPVIAPAPAKPSAEPVVKAAPEAKPATTEIAAANPAKAEAGAVFPAPVRVKTVTVPTTAKTSAVGSAAPEAATTAEAAPDAETPAETVEADAATQVAAVEPAEGTPVAANAYATDDGLVSEGIQAVLGVAARERAANSPVAVRKKTPQEQTQAALSDDEPEMAGTSAGTRRIRSGVNMRAAPKSGSPIIGTIPTNAAVTVAPGCQHWCSVSYNGKRGFIYKSFLR